MWRSNFFNNIQSPPPSLSHTGENFPNARLFFNPHPILSSPFFRISSYFSGRWSSNSDERKRVLDSSTIRHWLLFLSIFKFLKECALLDVYIYTFCCTNNTPVIQRPVSILVPMSWIVSLFIWLNTACRLASKIATAWWSFEHDSENLSFGQRPRAALTPIELWKKYLKVYIRDSREITKNMKGLLSSLRWV